MIRRMADFSAREITASERALARVAFGTALERTPVRIVQAPGIAPWGAMAPLRRMIVFGRWRAATDFARAGLGEQGWFIHELAHVWQAERGAFLPLAKLSALGRSAYRVIPDGRPFAAFNIEAQAEIARLTFLARRGAPDRSGPDPDWLESRWPIARPPSSGDAAWV